MDGRNDNWWQEPTSTTTCDRSLPALPSEGERLFARPVRPQELEPPLPLFRRGAGAGFDPPQGVRRSLRALEPVRAAPRKRAVLAPVGIVAERGDRGPHREVDQ